MKRLVAPLGLFILLAFPLPSQGQGSWTYRLNGPHGPLQVVISQQQRNGPSTFVRTATKNGAALQWTGTGTFSSTDPRYRAATVTYHQRGGITSRLEGRSSQGASVFTYWLDNNGKIWEQAKGEQASTGSIVRPQTTCPLMGGPIDRSVFVDYKGKRIYFCCPGCDKKFKADPERYLREMRSKGVEPEATLRQPQAQTNCPIMTDNKIRKDLFVDHKGKRIYFCCPGCDKKFKADPERYLQQLRAQGVVLESSPSGKGTQANCPIMTGNKVRKDLFVDHNGKRIYFCCPGCDKKFKADPERYIQQLRSRGVVLETSPARKVRKRRTRSQ